MPTEEPHFDRQAALVHRPTSNRFPESLDEDAVADRRPALERDRDTRATLGVNGMDVQVRFGRVSGIADPRDRVADANAFSRPDRDAVSLQMRQLHVHPAAGEDDVVAGGILRIGL